MSNYKCHKRCLPLSSTTADKWKQNKNKSYLGFWCRLNFKLFQNFNDGKFGLNDGKTSANAVSRPISKWQKMIWANLRFLLKIKSMKTMMKLYEKLY